MKILTILGTRPEAIKLAPIIRELNLHKEVESRVCSTGQHKELLNQQLQILDINVDYALSVMQIAQDLFSVTTRTLSGIKKVLQNYEPDLVVVQGDTTTAFIGALAAYYMKIPIAHVEAGLRTYDKLSPFPEEANRVFIDHISDFLFAPTLRSANNLMMEEIPSNKILITGNTAIDSLLWMKDRQDKEVLTQRLREETGLELRDQFILVTGHRRESFGKPFEEICNGIKDIAENNDVQIVYSVHLNPNVQEPVNRILGNLSNVSLIPPLDYELFVFLMSRCKFIITDSGGISEEAPSLHKPVLIMRNKTERQEAITVGAAKLVGANRETMLRDATALLQNTAEYDKMSSVPNPFGNGKSAKKIVDALLGGMNHYNNA